MTLYRFAGFVLGLAGAALMWQSGIAVMAFFDADGARRLSALLLDADFSLRTLAALSAFIGGLAALTERRGGSWLAGLSASIFLVQTVSFMGGHGSVEQWQQEAIYLTILTCLFLAMTVSTHPSNEDRLGCEIPV